jgi:acyl dehydratase
MGRGAAMTLESVDLLTGQEIAVTDWIEIARDRIALFAEATEDRQWIHLDRARAAAESPYGGTIAHGFLTLSMLSHLSRDVLPVENIRMRVNYGLNRVRFPAAVPAGASIRGRFTLQSVRHFAEGADIAFLVTVEVRGAEKPCCVAEWIVRYYRA